MVLSGTVGPDAIVSNVSPTTSLNINDTTFAGYALLAKLPPFTWDKCFLIVLISCIDAPQPNNSWVVFCKSDKLIPSIGAVNIAEPPPDIKKITKSSGFNPFKWVNNSFVELTPASSGTGWPPSVILIVFNGLIGFWPCLNLY